MDENKAQQAGGCGKVGHILNDIGPEGRDASGITRYCQTCADEAHGQELHGLDVIPEPYRSAHKETSNHRDVLLSSRWVGCIYCLLIYLPRSIKQWIDHDQTAVCPICGVDAVIALSPERFWSDFLPKMREYWFGDPKTEVFLDTARRDITDPTL